MNKSGVETVMDPIIRLEALFEIGEAISWSRRRKENGAYRPIKEVERPLNEILKQITKSTIRRETAKKNLFEEAKPKTKKVRFILDAAEAERVFLAGAFNNWDVHSLAMKKDKKGTWEADFALPAGRYEYRFWVDDAWHDDPNAQGRVENPLGSQKIASG